MSTQVILLEKIEKLGNMGDVVNVKPGFARNYLLPQSKALRATKDNVAYFESQKASLEKANDEKKAEAEKRAKSLNGLSVAIVRQASEGGQLYGSVTSRDIAESIGEASKEKIERHMVDLNQNFKTIGLFPVPVTLHPEVKVEVTVNIARSADEAAQQAKSGKALIHNDQAAEAQADADAREGLMEDEALEAAKTAEEEQAVKDAEDTAKAEEKSAARAEKKAAKAETEAENEEAAPAEIGAASTDAPAEEEDKA